MRNNNNNTNKPVDKVEQFAMELNKYVYKYWSSTVQKTKDGDFLLKGVNFGKKSYDYIVKTKRLTPAGKRPSTRVDLYIFFNGEEKKLNYGKHRKYLTHLYKRLCMGYAPHNSSNRTKQNPELVKKLSREIRENKENFTLGKTSLSGQVKLGMMRLEFKPAKMGTRDVIKRKLYIDESLVLSGNQLSVLVDAYKNKSKKEKKKAKIKETKDIIDELLK